MFIDAHRLCLWGHGTFCYTLLLLFCSGRTISILKCLVSFSVNYDVWSVSARTGEFCLLPLVQELLCPHSRRLDKHSALWPDGGLQVLEVLPTIEDVDNKRDRLSGRIR